MADDEEYNDEMDGDDYGDDAVDELEDGNEERGEDGERIEILPPTDKGTASRDKRSPILLRRCSSHSSWLLIGLASLLLVQPSSAAPAIDGASDLLGVNRSEIAAPDEISWRNETKRERRQEFIDLTPRTSYSSGGDYELTIDHWIGKDHVTLLLRRSGKTMIDYMKFVEKNCIEFTGEPKDDATFLSWERDQFALALKTSMLGSPTRKDRSPQEREEHVAQWMRLHAILPVVNETMLESQCKPIRGVYDEDRIMQLTANDILENEIVNSVFANMYKRGLFYADSFRPIYRERKKDLSATLAPPEDDHAFTKEVLRSLKR